MSKQTLDEKKTEATDMFHYYIDNNGEFELAEAALKKSRILELAIDRNKKQRLTCFNDKVKIMESKQKKRHLIIMKCIKTTSGKADYQRTMLTKYRMKYMGTSWLQLNPMTAEQKKQQTLKYDCIETAYDTMWKHTNLCEDVMGEIVAYL